MLHWFMLRPTAATPLPLKPSAAASTTGSTLLAPLQSAGKSASKKASMGRTRSPLQCIPGVGPATVDDFHRLGIMDVADLKGRDSQALYDALAGLDGQPHDRCVLYVFRAAVYYASTADHDPERLKWWNWKDTPPRRKAR